LCEVWDVTHSGGATLYIPSPKFFSVGMFKHMHSQIIRTLGEEKLIFRRLIIAIYP